MTFHNDGRHFGHRPSDPLPRWYAPAAETARYMRERKPPRADPVGRPFVPNYAPGQRQMIRDEMARPKLSSRAKRSVKRKPRILTGKQDAAHILCRSGTAWKDWMSFPPPGWEG